MKRWGGGLQPLGAGDMKVGNGSGRCVRRWGGGLWPLFAGAVLVGNGSGSGICDSGVGDGGGESTSERKWP